MEMIDHVCAATVEYIDHMPKSKRKKYGQFFTKKRRKAPAFRYGDIRRIQISE